MIETIKSYEEALMVAVTKYSNYAKKYMEARKKYAEVELQIQMAIARKISEYHAKKKNIGMEMAIAFRLEESIANNDNFRNIYNQYLTSLAEYKGLDRALDACNSEVIALQTVMKYTLSGEIYTRERHGS